MFAPQFVTDKTERILDSGYCLLQMSIGSSTNRGSRRDDDSQTDPFLDENLPSAAAPIRSEAS
jgi:hypothetical protein